MNKLAITGKSITGFVLTIVMATTAVGQEQEDSMDRANRRQQQIELSKTNSNHNMLANLNGEWSFKGRHIPADTSIKPIETFGTITRKGIWENRYFITETTSGIKIPMPWADGKEMYYHDMYVEGYDNVKNKFFFTLVANHWGTGYMRCEGNYNSTTRILNYEGEFEPSPGVIVKVLRNIKFIDSDNYEEEWRRTVDGKEIQRSVSRYTRIKSGK